MLLVDDPNVHGSIKPMLIIPLNGAMAQQVKVSVDAGEGQCAFLNLQEVEVHSQCIEGDACLQGLNSCDASSTQPVS